MKQNNFKIYGSAVSVFLLSLDSLSSELKPVSLFATPLETLTYRFNFAFLAALLFVICGFFKNKYQGQTQKETCSDRRILPRLYGIAKPFGLVFSTSIESGIIFAIVPILAKVIASLFSKGKYQLEAECLCLYVCCCSDHNVLYLAHRILK